MTANNELGGQNRRNFSIVLLAALGALLFLFGMYLLNSQDTPKPSVARIQEITLVQPPPPPPPPPPPEPEKVIEEKEVIEPTEQAEVQTDVEELSNDPVPSDTPPTPQLGGLNRSADIGSDSFNLAAGKGGGLFGRGGGSGGSWEAYVATHIRRALQRDERTRIASGYVEVVLSIDLNGRFERAELISSTGDPDVDAAIQEVLSRLPPLSRGRPASVRAVMMTGLNLRKAEG